MKTHMIDVTALALSNGKAAYAAQVGEKTLSKSLSRSNLADATLQGALDTLKTLEKSLHDGDSVDIRLAVTGGETIALAGASKPLNAQVRSAVQTLHSRGVSVILLAGETPSKTLTMKAEMALAF